MKKGTIMGSIRSIKQQAKVQERIDAAAQQNLRDLLSEQDYLEWLEDTDRHYTDHFAQYQGKSSRSRCELPDCYGIVGGYVTECCCLCPAERSCGDLRCQRMDEDAMEQEMVGESQWQEDCEDWLKEAKDQAEKERTHDA